MIAAVTGIAWADYLIGAAGALAAVTTIWKKGLAPFLHACRTVTGYGETLTEIAQQFKPNHGTSLKDSLDRVEGRADRIEAKLDGLSAEVPELRGMFQRHAESDAEHFDKVSTELAQLSALVRAPVVGVAKTEVTIQREET